MRFHQLIESTDIAFRDEVRGYHKGQTDITLFATIDGKVAGSIQYSTLEGREPSVQIISVLPEFRRRGVGKALLKELQRQFPDEEINLGLLSHEGSALVSSMETHVVEDPEARRLHDRLGEVEKLQRDYQAYADEFHARERSEEERRAFLVKVQDWNDLHDEQRKLEDILRDLPLEKRLFVTESEVLTEGRDAYLFHGTDLLSAISIIRDNKIRAGQHYEHHTPGVSLTRDYLIARDFGTYWERQCPIVFVFDQQKLVQSRMKVQPYRDTSEPGVYRDREAEELIHGDIDNLSQYLISINVDLDHLEAALKSKPYWEWMSEHGSFPDLKFVNNRGTFIRLINQYIVRHPLLNKWRPRVTHKPGTKDDGKPFLG